MRPVACLACLFSVALLACGKPVSVAAEAGHLAPFDSLAALTLGMSAPAVQSARPNAAFVAYRGFRERLDSARVYYGFPAVDVGEDAVAPRAGLDEVVAEWLATPGDDSRQIWRTAIAKAIDRKGSPSYCLARGGDQATDVAVWQTRRASFQIMRAPPVNTGTEQLPYRLVMIVGGRDRPQSGITASARVPCATILNPVAQPVK